MTSTGLVTLKKIEALLDDCAPGAVIEEKTHHLWVHYQGTTYRGLPRGAHGARKNPEIQVGHVRRMARFFDIVNCAKKHLPR